MFNLPDEIKAINLPDEIRAKLSLLELELSEGDITEKGYAKKRNTLLAPYLLNSGPEANKCIKRRHKHTRNESRYHSEIRQEAVQRALSDWRCKKPPNNKHHEENDRPGKSGDFRPIIRRSSNKIITNTSLSHSDSEPDDNTDNEKSSSGFSNHYHSHFPPLATEEYSLTPSPTSPDNHLIVKRENKIEGTLQPSYSDFDEMKQASVHQCSHIQNYINIDASQIQIQHQQTPSTSKLIDNEQTSSAVDKDDKIIIASTDTEKLDYTNSQSPPRHLRVSQKIQRMLALLQKPKTRQLNEFYNSNGEDDELEVLADSPIMPTGPDMTPVHGFLSNETFQLPHSTHSIFSILQRWATSQPKSLAGIQLTNSEKPKTLTYAKLLSKALKISSMLLNKQVTITTNGTKERVQLCVPGDRVALIYPNTEPISFLTAFYGCLLAGVSPIPIEVPLLKRTTEMKQFGFLLGNCGVWVALTTESCYKGLPKAKSLAPMSATISGNISVSPSSTFNSSVNADVFNASTTGSNTSAGSTGSTKSSSHFFHHYVNSGDPCDIADFKGWPRLLYMTTDSKLPKPPKDWQVPSLLSDDSCAYIEYILDQEGIKAVQVSRRQLLSHAHLVSNAMCYKENETMICLLDFKRESGLWHSILAAIYSGMQVVFVSYSQMKANPSAWLHQVVKYRAKIAICKSRDLHWSLIAATEECAKWELNSLRAIVVADGANPWSLSSCDSFISYFTQSSLNPSVICPCSGSSETGLISIRRPLSTDDAASDSISPTGRGVLSLSALSCSVVRVESENSLTSLTLQDAGQIIQHGLAIIVSLDGTPKLCKADEIGEICLHAPSTSTSYYGLKGLTQQTFSLIPQSCDGKQLGPISYTRSGLVGFFGPAGLLFVIGHKESMLKVSGRYHNADDLIATVLAVQPMKLIYRGRIAIFSINVLKDERIVIIGEQKPDVSEEECFAWMVRVIQAVDSIHHTGVYCIALVLPNHLPKTSHGGIHVYETKTSFINGYLHPTTILMCPQNCVLNLPKPRIIPEEDVGPAAVFVGNIIQGAHLSETSGRQLKADSDQCIYLFDILRQRAQQTPGNQLYSLVNSKGSEVDSLTCLQLFKKAERIGALLTEKGHLSAGNHVAIILPPGIDLITAVFGCFAAGLVPVCISPPAQRKKNQIYTSMANIRMIVGVSRAVALLSNATLIKLLKSREFSHRGNTAWPTVLDIDDAPSSSITRQRKGVAGETNQRQKQPSDICYLDFAMNGNGQVTGVVVTAQGAANQCRNLKLACELYTKRTIVLCMDPYSGLGFTLWCLASVYCGHTSILIPPSEVEQQPLLWVEVLSQSKIRDTFSTYPVAECTIKEVASKLKHLKDKNLLDLTNLRNCVFIAEERPRYYLSNKFIKLLGCFGLNQRAVSTSFGCRTNSSICLQGTTNPDLSTVYIDARSLRNDRIVVKEKGAARTIPIMEVGKLLPETKVVVADPKTKGQCADLHLGEIWVASPHNVSGFFSLFGEETRYQTDQFNARLKTGDTKTVYARTGFLGFMVQNLTSDSDISDPIYILGSIEDSLILRGMRYYPIDIEETVSRAHKDICESAIFTWTHLLVVVVETTAPESDALDLVPAITNIVLECHHLIVGVVVIVDEGCIPISNGVKLRAQLRDLFLKDRLDPIYVAYNM